MIGPWAKNALKSQPMAGRSTRKSGGANGWKMPAPSRGFGVMSSRLR